MPESTTGDSSSNSVTGDQILPPSTGLRDTDNPNMFGESFNDVFDPLNWLFDGEVPFPVEVEDMPIEGHVL